MHYPLARGISIQQLK